MRCVDAVRIGIPSGLVVLLAAAVPAAADACPVVDLGTLGGAASAATDVNASEQVVGWSETPAGRVRAFLWDRGTMLDLGALPGGDETRAAAIDDAGRVVGTGDYDPWADTVPGHVAVEQGFLWSLGTIEPLGALSDPGLFSRREGESSAWGLADAGGVVGCSLAYVENRRHATRWSIPVSGDAWPEDLVGAADRADSCARDESAEGRVVGDRAGHAFAWDNGEAVAFERPAGAERSVAVAVNARGGAVGWYETASGAKRAAAWDASGSVTLLEGLDDATDTRALDLDDRGILVGSSGGRAVAWVDGTLRDLNGLAEACEGWVLESAAAIGASGAVVGAGVLDGAPRAFLLRLPPELVGRRAALADFEARRRARPRSGAAHSVPLPYPGFPYRLPNRGSGSR